MPREPVFMSKRQSQLSAVGKAAGEDPRRSALFRWLVENHDALAASLAGPRVNWKPLIQLAVDAGALTHTGRPPSDVNMRRTWRKARLYVSSQRKEGDRRPADANAPRARHPRELRAGARPPEAVLETVPRDQATGLRTSSLPRVAGSKPDGEAGGGFRPTVEPGGIVLGKKVTRGPYLEKPDVSGMDHAEAQLALVEWNIKRRQLGIAND
jgi:hypothetical protein